MAINLEISYEDEEFKINNINKINIINGYYNFEFNDVDLNKFWRILREGKNSKFLLNIQNDTNKLTNSLYNPEDYLGKNEVFEKAVYEDFNDLYSKLSDCFLNLNSYPYLKNTLLEDFKNKLSLYKENKYKQIYFFILFLSKRKLITEKIKEFYRKKFTSNFQNLSVIKNTENSIGDLFGYLNNNNLSENPIEKDTKNVLNTLNLDILKTNSFKEFALSLSKLYSLAEVISFNLSLLNEFFGFHLEFEQDKFSLNNNIGFSLETFAKKNILKLISYCLKKLTFNFNFKEFNYKRLLIFIASSLTSGISFNDLIFKNILLKDIKQFAIAVD